MPLRFEDIRDSIAQAAGGAVELRIAEMEGELGSAVSEYLGLASLRLQQFHSLEQGESTIRIASTIKVPIAGTSRKVEIGLDARFWREGSGVGYTLVFAVPPSSTRALLGDLGRLLEAMPVRPEGLWLSLSSAAWGAIRIETPGQELDEAFVEAGKGYMFRLGGKLLKNLKLDQTVFYLANFPEPAKFTTRTRILIPIGPLLQFTINSISLDGDRSVGFTGEGVFDFFGQKIAFLTTIHLTLGSIAFEIDLGRFVPRLDYPFFKPLSLTRAVASFEGSLASYAVGVGGEFVIAGSGNAGEFLVKYASGATTVIPDLFELHSNQLILSDLVTVATGVPVTLPALLDRVIVLKDNYLYHARVPGLRTLSGVPSIAGMKAHSNVSLLGYEAYGEVVAVGGAFAANFQFAPIKLGGILEISGSGHGSPKGYSGNAVGKGAIMVSVDSANRTAAASLKVRFLDQASFDTMAALNDGSLDFLIKTKLPPPLGETTFNVALTHETAKLGAKISMPVSVTADWGFGKFSINKAAQVDADLKIVTTRNGATGRADIRAALGPVKLAFPIDFDPLDISGLVARIQEEVAKHILEALKDSVTWLKAVLDKTIEFLHDTAQLAEAIGYELRFAFKQTAKQAAAMLRKAGYNVNNAFLVLEEGFQAGYDNIKDLLQEAGGYAERQVVDWLRDVCESGTAKFTARTVADIMLRAGYGTERALAEVQTMLKNVKLTAEVLGQLLDSPREVAKFLMDAKVGVEKAAEYLAEGFYRLTSDAVKTTLVQTGYAAKEVERAVENVWRESGRVIGDIRDELGRAWERYRPSVTVRWRVVW